MRRLPTMTVRCVVLSTALFGLATVACGQATVAVISNRTNATVPFSVAQTGVPDRDFRLAGGDNLTLPLSSSSRLTLHTGNPEPTYTLSPDTAYVLFDREGSVALTAIGLHEGPASPPFLLPAIDWNAAPHERMDDPRTPGPVVVPIKIMVDEDERAARAVWEKRLRARIADASEILEHDCGIKLQVVDTGTWESDNSIDQFPKSLEEFERKVAVKAERLVIGFTSQYTLVRGMTHLGGIRGPLARHLLVREWSQVITEPERLEVLLHELGHFFGAAHSPEPDSVMRPMLADRKARSAKFRIGFDPLNTLAVTRLGDQLRSGGGRTGFVELALPVQLQLRPIYAELARAIPDDPNPRRYVTLIDRSGVERTALATAAVIAALEANADRNSSAGGKRADRFASAEWRLRTAAKLSLELPAELRSVACLLAVALTGPQREPIAGHPLARPICARILGAPGEAGRPAAVSTSVRGGQQARIEHLLATSALALLVGGQRADAAALIDAGISDPAASSVDLESYTDACAGVCLAARLIPGRWRISVARLAEEKDLNRFLPPPADELELAGKLEREDFEHQFGSATDPRFLSLRAKLCEKISALPAYR
jgi:hypothetical protein